MSLIEDLTFEDVAFNNDDDDEDNDDVDNDEGQIPLVVIADDILPDLCFLL